MKTRESSKGTQMMFDGGIQQKGTTTVAKHDPVKTHKSAMTVDIPDESVDILVVFVNLDL